MKVQRVAVLGAGIMGSSTALYLARAGIQVDLFDAADRPFSGASRWNEGKIHLGFLYANDLVFTHKSSWSRETRECHFTGFVVRDLV